MCLKHNKRSSNLFLNEQQKQLQPTWAHENISREFRKRTNFSQDTIRSAIVGLRVIFRNPIAAQVLHSRMHPCNQREIPFFWPSSASEDLPDTSSVLAISERKHGYR